jgi:hypothetical protein
MDFALRTAWHHGTAALRTHLDGTALGIPEELRQLVYREFDHARDTWSSRGLTLQVCLSAKVQLLAVDIFPDVPSESRGLK